jgi:phosphoribosylcarboxyaminoimidazole (NCAIR) mutase
MLCRNKVVGIVMGSKSDWDRLKHAADILDPWNILYEVDLIPLCRHSAINYRLVAPMVFEKVGKRSV